ncbi:adenylyltransferase/cytidyltransferase family protein [Candidatus Uhrbacteria bacterium]|nr:adenylyltransferase/cytidyltransferase family protein [Candidatus Uhrbacteria bacterium]
MAVKRVLVFGTFDGLHAGHLFFLRSAKAKGTHLIVAVARDAHIKTLKDKRPILSEQKRLEAVKLLKIVDEAYLCDAELGSYRILESAKPDLIVFGHDQQNLERDLVRFMSEHEQYLPLSRMKKV